MDGSGQDETVFHGDRPGVPNDFSPDGRYLAVQLRKRAGVATGEDIWMLPLFGDRKPFPFIASEFEELAGAFSPDGKWFCYTSNESGRSELYVVPFPGPGGKFQVSTGGSQGGSFFKGGKEILYGTLENEVVSVEMKEGASGLEFGSPKLLFKFPPVSAVTITPDGERILAALLPQVTATSRVALVTGWTAGLEKK